MVKKISLREVSNGVILTENGKDISVHSSVKDALGCIGEDLKLYDEFERSKVAINITLDIQII